jgi:hypothetical protein
MTEWFDSFATSMAGLEAVPWWPMTNPWLEIPEADYTGHMSAEEVGQLHALSSLFHDVLRLFAPADVLILGCSSGNGFEQIDPVQLPVAEVLRAHGIPGIWGVAGLSGRPGALLSRQGVGGRGG